MNIYDKEEIGNIAIIKNIIFSDNEKMELDHAWSHGRPCLILFEDNEYYYFLTITSTERFSPKYVKQYFKIEENDYKYRYKSRYTNKFLNKKNSSNSILKGWVNLENIYKIPIYGLDALGKIKFDFYKNVVQRLKEYHKNENLNELMEKVINVKR